ncbi:MAG: segregation/condensation protein A [candidate division WOR-3 bacterium]
MMMDNIEIQTEVFSGPIELLVYLVRKNAIDVLEIPLARITDEYLSYLRTAKNLNLELGIEFILMATVLIRLKIINLLPQTSPCEEIPETKISLDEIVAEYRKYAQIADLLRQFENKRMLFFPRRANFKDEILERQNDIYSLILILKNLLAKNKESPSLDISVPEIKLEDKLIELKKILEKQELITFSALISQATSITEVILIFIALLELVRLGEIKVSQNQEFSEIFLEKY